MKIYVAHIYNKRSCNGRQKNQRNIENQWTRFPWYVFFTILCDNIGRFSGLGVLTLPMPKPKGSNYSSSTNFFPSTLHNESCYNYPDDSDMNTDFYLGFEKNTGFASKCDDLVEGNEALINQEVSDEETNESLPVSIFAKEKMQGNKEYDMQSPDEANESANINSSKNKKRSANSNVLKNKRNVKSKKTSKVVSADINDEYKKVGLNRQSSSSCLSDDFSNDSQELSEKELSALNSSGKTRAGRGSATDPQSLYARKRREKINERLRILQNLVPNGTKVDISTMLEEAVQYVNFLQLQIKLLSSNDLWMYAPLAYNGMDIGLDSKINMLNNIRE